jgi:hypothetical protein
MSPYRLILHNLQSRSMEIMVSKEKLERKFDGLESLPLKVQRLLVIFKLECGKHERQSRVLFLKLKSTLLDFQNIQVRLP